MPRARSYLGTLTGDAVQVCQIATCYQNRLFCPLFPFGMTFTSGNLLICVRKQRRERDVYHATAKEVLVGWLAGYDHKNVDERTTKLIEIKEIRALKLALHGD